MLIFPSRFSLVCSLFTDSIWVYGAMIACEERNSLTQISPIFHGPKIRLAPNVASGFGVPHLRRVKGEGPQTLVNSDKVQRRKSAKEKKKNRQKRQKTHTQFKFCVENVIARGFTFALRLPFHFGEVFFFFLLWHLSNSLTSTSGQLFSPTRWLSSTRWAHSHCFCYFGIKVLAWNTITNAKKSSARWENR